MTIYFTFSLCLSLFPEEPSTRDTFTRTHTNIHILRDPMPTARCTITTRRKRSVCGLRRTCPLPPRPRSLRSENIMQISSVPKTMHLTYRAGPFVQKNVFDNIHTTGFPSHVPVLLCGTRLRRLCVPVYPPARAYALAATNSTVVTLFFTRLCTIPGHAFRRFAADGKSTVVRYRLFRFSGLFNWPIFRCIEIFTNNFTSPLLSC